MAKLRERPKDSPGAVAARRIVTVAKTCLRRRIVRTIRMQLLLAPALLLPAACTSIPSPPAVASCPPAADCPPCPACPPARQSTLEGRYAAVAWGDIPCWRDVARDPSLRALLVG